MSFQDLLMHTQIIQRTLHPHPKALLSELYIDCKTKRLLFMNPSSALDFDIFTIVINVSIANLRQVGNKE